MRWEGKIKEWTRMDFASSARAAENRTRWKGTVAKFICGAPDDLTRLWDRIEKNRKKAHAYLQPILKAHVKFQKDRPKTVGVARTRCSILPIHFCSIKALKRLS